MADQDRPPIDVEPPSRAGPGAPPQRRYLTMLFGDLCGSTRLGAALEAEHYAEVLAELATLYRDVVARHGGQVIRIQGDGVLAIFGHPWPQEDDGRRAVEAALELHAAVRALARLPTAGLDGLLRLHSGVHAGLVLVGAGDPLRGQLELMGHAPNVAAKLADAAPDDAVLVSEDTLGPAVSRFRVVERHEFRPDASAAALSVLHIDGLRASVPRAGAAVAEPGALVGRAREIEQMVAAPRAGTAGTPRHLVLLGPPGVGKTALAHTVLARERAAGADVLRGACDGVTAGRPLEPFIQMLRTRLAPDPGAAATSSAPPLARLHGLLADGDATQVDTHAGVLAAVLAPDAGTAQAPPQPAAVAEAFAALLRGLARRAPVWVFVDDWHRADLASHQLLAALAAMPPGAVPAALLLAARGASPREVALPDTFDALPVAPLDDDDATALVRRRLPSADPFLVDEIRRQAGGSPLFIEELCHRVERDGQLPAWPVRAAGPGWLGLLIESRVSRLPDGPAGLVRTAAILGETLPVWLFEQVAGCRADDPDMRALEREDLLFPGEQPGTLRFKHAIAREVIYQSVGLHQRRALHREAAQALLRQARADGRVDEASEALAYHLAAAGEALEAAAHAEKAAARAMRTSAVDRAQAQYRAVLSALDQAGAGPAIAARWCVTAQALGLACVFDPSRADLPLFERALERARATGDARLLARATYWLGYIGYALGDQRAALGHIRQALDLAATCGDGPLHVQVQATLGQVLAAAGHNEEALTLLRQAADAKSGPRRGGGVAVGLVYTLATLGQALGDLGRFDEAEGCFEQAVGLIGNQPHEIAASTHGLHAAVLLWRGRWDEAHDAAMRAYRIGQRVRSLFTLTMGQASAAYADWCRHHDDASLKSLQGAAGWLLPRGNALFRSLLHGWLADALADAGHAEDARRQAAAALRRARQLDRLGAPMACRAMARLAAAEGDAERARRWLHRAGQQADARQSAHERAANAGCAAQVAAALGDGARAVIEGRHAAAAAAALGMTLSSAPPGGGAPGGRHAA